MRQIEVKAIRFRPPTETHYRILNPEERARREDSFICRAPP